MWLYCAKWIKKDIKILLINNISYALVSIDNLYINKTQIIMHECLVLKRLFNHTYNIVDLIFY